MDYDVFWESYKKSLIVLIVNLEVIVPFWSDNDKIV